MKKLVLFFIALLTLQLSSQAQPLNLSRPSDRIYLDSKDGHGGIASWEMKRADDNSEWMPAIVPGTVLNSLVYNNVYPEPYYGMNNEINKNIIPDIAKAGRDFYTYWFRTNFDVPVSFSGKQIWLQFDGINYRAEVYVNGHLLSTMNGMFISDKINITDFAKIGQENDLVVKVCPVDMPGTTAFKNWGAANNEYHNGGDGNIGYNTTMLMSVGWDFTFNDGIRDRNTGIWRSVSLYATGNVTLQNPFVKSELNNPDYNIAKETVSVEVTNPTNKTVKCTVVGKIEGTDITFSKDVSLLRGEVKEVSFVPEEYNQLIIQNPRLWWPIFKGDPNLYTLHLDVVVEGMISDKLDARFGIREIVSDQNTPDKSRQFYINGKKIFVRGTNWIPEAMLRNSDERTYTELRYTKQSGINFIRMWGGGIAESDYFFQLCDEMGLMVWQEFWMTGDTRHPHDRGVYFANVESTVKRLRNHPSLAYYVCSNESTETSGIKDLIYKLDSTRGYQMQSECDGIHDGSPYKQVNPMQNYENTASERGSRIDGFNPEYGSPTIPLVESLREMMDEKDLWPINKEVWDYHDGGGFHLMTTMYTDLVNNYGEATSIEDYCKKGQCVGAINSKSIWETWNYNKYEFGDRYASGLLFWYHNCPVWQVCGRMWDYMLEPTASLYYTQNSLEPLHPQFDYLKNTVSVYNEYYNTFNNYTVNVDVYDINSKKILSKSAIINIPSDGVANDVIKIDFPEDISQVHFIKLKLFDNNNKEIAQNFYWRSKDKYEGKKTLTGPATSGFEPLSSLKKAKLSVKKNTWVENDRQFVKVRIKNVSSVIAFMTQLKVVDKEGTPVRPSFYSDNFFSLLPGEVKEIIIDTKTSANQLYEVKVNAWND